MCGIAGILKPGASAGWLEERITTMTAALVHRGPDAGGVFIDQSAGLALGHRRLSIIDLSPTGAQPMTSPSGRYVIVFNGEIYNFQALRATLLASGAVLQGRSDTEVLLAAIEAWGLESALERSTGMFAFALWDRRQRELTLVRDRCGEKPLYFGRVADALVFGSELKAFRGLPGWPCPVDREALAEYFRYGCVPAPRSIHAGIAKLRPGEWIAFDDRGATLRQSRYWTPDHLPALRRPAAHDEAGAIEALDSHLRAAVSACMVADVPLGAFLSGGLDSTAVVAIMQACSPEPVRTFTIGFDHSGYDEAGFAAAIAAHLGTRHTEVRVSPRDALAVVPSLPLIYDEPFADSSQIPTCLVARIAREHVAVCLSGDGGDEVFGGYNRHTWGVGLWQRAMHVPGGARRALGRALTAVPGPGWDRLAQAAGAVLPARARPFSAGDRIHKLARLLVARDDDDLYRRAIIHWERPPLAPSAASPQAPVWQLPARDGLDLAERMMLADLGGYLPDDVLVKLDRASMAVGLESRAPLLDHRLIEFAWSLPVDLKIRRGTGKWILRQVLSKYVPTALFERPKMGFAMPIDDWLRGPLRDWAEALLAPAHIEAHGLLDSAAVHRCWHEHVALGQQRQAQLWDVLMFQAWYEATYK